jgi:hypothetical protein
MTRDELRRLRREQNRRIAAAGFFVPEILPAAAAFTRRPRLVGNF